MFDQRAKFRIDDLTHNTLANKLYVPGPKPETLVQTPSVSLRNKEPKFRHSCFARSRWIALKQIHRVIKFIIRQTKIMRQTTSLRQRRLQAALLRRE